MKYYLFILLVGLSTTFGFSQTKKENTKAVTSVKKSIDSSAVKAESTVKGIIIDATSRQPLENVNIVNLNQVIGTATNVDGEFELRAQANDTLHLSYLGFKSIKVKVTNDWVDQIEKSTITLTELALALEEVVVTGLKLTGYLEVDIKQVNINTNYRYSISGLSNGYEAGKKQPSAVTKVLGSIFNPLDFLYNTFSSKGKELRKLKKMKEDDNIRNTLAARFDREMLIALLGVTKVDLDEIVSQCNYSEEFVTTANDLQILDAISECYEEYKVLNRGRKKRI
ncbi:carboxypeptidase-like regulatory domain-containing protein [Olleya marilimosa]|uniref:Carboxypeptidase-like regulatory domain-containing protein n=1 Tax=Olleya marilimosa TaxID=272164 RepID=A0ABR8LQ47_9FLAO|nr:carboxypeptidase-like regulatory domain-containing protein [Olleya marilimosa]MBD3862352.1 carboxypeptidase-like regulatory domain-containing protein [Olleya marilimosa]MBD3889850.1 carboxypeptidase-like regulatory domain-containing protein [Olleya marilimosa]|tara:strand:+ start:36468 stop:37313 length:846 start_codon:yes stop_codon:yes gene_type:complete